MSLISNAPALRRRACALALPGIPVALLAGTLVSPTDSTENAVQLQAAAAHAGRWQGAALLELLTATLFPLAAAGIVHLVRRRGATLAHLGALLGGLGTLGMTSIALRHLFIYGLTATDHASALKVLDRLDNHAGAIAFPLMMAGPLAWIVLSGAAVRGEFVVEWWSHVSVGFGGSCCPAVAQHRRWLGQVGVEEMDVGVECERRLVVAKEPLDVHGVPAAPEKHRRAGVSERVEPDPTLGPLPHRGLDPLAEAREHPATLGRRRAALARRALAGVRPASLLVRAGSQVQNPAPFPFANAGFPGRRACATGRDSCRDD
jgi:hypothetical protein